MPSSFFNQARDVQWLKETHLNGVPVPMDYLYFKSYILTTDADRVTSVELFNRENPVISEPSHRIAFTKG